MKIFPVKSETAIACVNAACVGRVSRPVLTEFCLDGTGVPSYGLIYGLRTASRNLNGMYSRV